MPDYKFLKLDDPGSILSAAQPTSLANRVSERGFITGAALVGGAGGGPRVYLDDHGDFTVLPTPTTAWPGDVLNSGVAAHTQVTTTGWQGFVTNNTSGTGFTAETTPVNPFSATNFTVNGTNGASDTVGTYFEAGGTPHGYIQIKGHTSDSTLSPTALQGSVGLDGSTPAKTIKTVTPADINGGREVVGSYQTNDGLTHGFFATVDPGAVPADAFKITSAATVDVPGALHTAISGVDNLGRLVGTYQDSLGKEHGFLRGVAGKLSTIDAPGAAAKGTELLGIDNRGDIVGAFVNGSGVQHGFLATKGLGGLLTFGAETSLAKDLTPTTIPAAGIPTTPPPAGSPAFTGLSVSPFGVPNLSATT